MMKKIFVALLIGMVAACTSEEGTELAEKRERLEKLKGKISELKDSVKMLESEIRELDTGLTERIVPVSTVELQTRPFSHYFEVHGVVEASKNVLVNPEIAGTVKTIHVNEGDWVKQGQLVVTLDTDILAQNLKDLESQYEFANQLYQKQKNLWEKNIGSEIQYLQAKNNKEMLENKIKTLKAQLNKAYMRAPFDGTVDKIFPKEGEVVSPAIQVFRIVNLSNVYVEADVSEAHIKEVKQGDSVEVVFPSINEKITTTITQVGQFINPNNRTFKIKINVKNTDKYFKPNLLANIKIKDLSLDSAIVVPSKYIQTDLQGKYVFTVEKNDGDKRAEKVYVRTGSSENGETLVLEGLSDGDILITEGYSSVVNKSKIEIKG